MKTLFVTGTGTAVGKTFICAHLLWFLRNIGVAAGYQKWVSTGDRNLPADLGYCQDLAGTDPAGPRLDLQVPYSFAMPASPHLAAELAGQIVDPERIVKSYKELRRCYEILLIEGVGGLLVPLRRDLLLADLLAGLKIPTMLVADSGLGTINHTLLTLEALRKRAIPILGVVFSDLAPRESLSAADEIIAVDNVKTIAELGKVRVLGRMPHVPQAGPPIRASRHFAPIGQVVWGLLAGDESRWQDTE